MKRRESPEKREFLPELLIARPTAASDEIGVLMNRLIVDSRLRPHHALDNYATAAHCSKDPPTRGAAREVRGARDYWHPIEVARLI
jgi:hypothetical protein